MTEYKCGSAKQCQFGDMCKPQYDIGGCSHYREKRPQTNEEWFCTLSTEEKANVIMNIKNTILYKEQVLTWLKEVHQ